MTSPTFGKGMKAFLIIVGAATGKLFSFYSSPLVYAIMGLIGLICFIILIVGVAASLKKKTEFNFLLMLICFTPVAMFIISIIMVPIFSTKQISVFVPEIVLMIAIGLNNIPYLFPKIKCLTSKKIFVSLFMPIVLMNIFNIYSIYGFNTKQNWRDTAKHIEENIQREDIILLTAPSSRFPFIYYYKGGIEAKEIKNTEELEEMIAEYQRIWIIRSYTGDPKREISEYLNIKSHKVTEKKFTRIDITCYEVR
jgi:hypothetical protein